MAVLLVFALANRETITRWAGVAADRAADPVHALQAEQQMDAATTALVQKWGTAGSFALAPSELRALDADVDWDEVVRFRSCLDGRAAVLTADAARGTQSRLLLRGFDQGTVKGDPGCPDSLTRIEPWGGV